MILKMSALASMCHIIKTKPPVSKTSLFRVPDNLMALPASRMKTMEGTYFDDNFIK